MTSPVKTSELPTQLTMTPDDYFIGVNDPLGVVSTVKFPAQGVFASIATPVVINSNLTVTANGTASLSNLSSANLSITDHHTPGTSGEIVTVGKMWFDSNYLYVAVANNTLKRVALQSF